MGYTEELSAFCSSLTYEDLPSDIVAKTKLLVLDYFANVYGSLALEDVSRIIEYIKSLGGANRASALGCGFRTGVHNAAFINGTTGEAIEAQDGLRFGGNHPGAAVIPAALAVAEEKHIGGREFIAAVVAGYEAADRPAAAMHPHHTLGGFLPTGTCGAFGAAVAAARLSGLDAAGVLNAIGNAGYLLPLSMAEHLMAGYTSKIVQAGQAASAGLTAAGLAGAGITGAPYVFEGSHLKGGFCKITTNSDPVLDRITDGLGEKYSISDIYIKPYTACRHTHGAVQAALEILDKEKFDPSQIEKVTINTYAIAAVAVRKTVAPGDTFVCAQFSLPYTTAAALIDGELGPKQLSAARIADGTIQDLMNRIKINVDGEIQGKYPEFTATRVDIKLRDGKTLSNQVDTPKGDPRAPMNADDVTQKLRSFAEGRDAADMDAVCDMTLKLEELDDVSKLAGLV